MNLSYCITIRSRYDHTNRQSQPSLGKKVNNRGKLQRKFLKHEGISSPPALTSTSPAGEVASPNCGICNTAEFDK